MSGECGGEIAAVSPRMQKCRQRPARHFLCRIGQVLFRLLQDPRNIAHVLEDFTGATLVERRWLLDQLAELAECRATRHAE